MKIALALLVTERNCMFFHRDHIECSEKYPQKFDRQGTIHLLIERAPTETQQNVLQRITASSLRTFEVSEMLF